MNDISKSLLKGKIQRYGNSLFSPCSLSRIVQYVKCIKGAIADKRLTGMWIDIIFKMKIDIQSIFVSGCFWLKPCTISIHETMKINSQTSISYLASLVQGRRTIFISMKWNTKIKLTKIISKMRGKIGTKIALNTSWVTCKCLRAGKLVLHVWPDIWSRYKERLGRLCSTWQ